MEPVRPVRQDIAGSDRFDDLLRILAHTLPIPCPDPACREGEDSRALHPEVCKKCIDFAAFGSWGYRLTEAAIPASRRAYCPNRQCGVML